MKKLTLTSLTLLAGITLAGCSESGEPTAQEAPSAPTATAETPAETPTEPSWSEIAPTPTEADPGNPYGLSDADLEYVFLSAVADEHHDYTTAELPDETLLSYGSEVCPALVAGASTDQIVFPGLTEMDNAVVVGAAVGTWCPEQLETLYAEAGI